MAKLIYNPQGDLSAEDACDLVANNIISANEAKELLFDLEE